MCYVRVVPTTCTFQGAWLFGNKFTYKNRTSFVKKVKIQEIRQNVLNHLNWNSSSLLICVGDSPHMFLTSEEVIFTCLDVVHVIVAPAGAGDGRQLEAAFWPSSGPSTWNLSIWQSCPGIPFTLRRCSIEIDAPSVLSTILWIHCHPIAVFTLSLPSG